MKDKTILITGATAGIGKATAIGLAQMGSTIVFNSRNSERGEKARSEIIKASGNQQVFVLPCDLSSLASIKTFADLFLNQFKRLDVLINNAGVWETSRSLTEDGF